MARGEWCIEHGRYFGNIIQCPECYREAQNRAREVKPRIRLHAPSVSYGWHAEITTPARTLRTLDFDHSWQVIRHLSGAWRLVTE